jgi:hypothetical protein
MSTSAGGKWFDPKTGRNWSGISVKHYGCCKCQTTHFEDEDIYQEHIWHQSKHGIDSMSMEARIRIAMMEEPER